MAEYIEREALKILFAGACAECRDSCAEFDGIEADCNQCLLNGVIKDAKSIPAADVQPVVLCKDCKHNNACLTQAFVEDESRVPFDRNTFFCADGKRANDA